MADAIHVLRDMDDLDLVVVFTGQHVELMREAADSLGIAADITIPVLDAGRTLTDLLAHVIGELGRARAVRDAACLVVQGDTASALAGALVSEMRAIPLVHVEAGVRSRLRDDPFPEETIRRIITSISEFHVCLSHTTRSNLVSEGIQEELIAVVPHPLRDRVSAVKQRPARNPTAEILVTLHRRERRQQRADRLVDLVTWLRGERADLKTSFVWHPSLDGDVADLAPRLREAGAAIVSPLAPDVFLGRLSNAALVITDSAGVAEEAQLLGRPLIAFRASAESRLDDEPTAPTCATESVPTAVEFIRSLGDLRTPAGEVSTPRAVGAGRAIATVVGAFARGGSAAAKAVSTKRDEHELPVSGGLRQ